MMKNNQFLTFKFILLSGLILGLTAGCNLVVRLPGQDEPPAAAQAAPTQIIPSPTASPTATPSPVPTVSTATPTPTLPPPSPTVLPAPTVTPTADLSMYRQAMLPAYANDIDTVFTAGASRYSIDASLYFVDDDRHYPVHVIGTEEIHYTNAEAVPLTELYFRLYPNLPGYGGQMTVGSVTVNGNPTEFLLEAEDTALRLPLVQPLPPGETVRLTLTFEAKIPGQIRGGGYNIFLHRDNTTTLPGFYPALAVYDDEGWNVELPPAYGDAVFLDVSLYRVSLTVPAEQVVAASGSLIDSQINDDGTKTMNFVSGPMRDFFIAMNPAYQTSHQIVNGITVTSYYPPELADGGERVLQYAVDALILYDRIFGPYPYAEFDIAATPTTAGGVEYPGIVVIAQNIYDQSGNFFEHATVHEVAHQWWYGVVGNDQFDEPWLDESLTNYSAMLYWEAVKGPTIADSMVTSYLRTPYEQAKLQGRDRSVSGSVAGFTEDDYNVFVYSKGPLFFEALRQAVTAETFEEILQSYYQQYRYKIVYSPDLLNTIEQVSGQNITPLYQQWIASPAE